MVKKRVKLSNKRKTVKRKLVKRISNRKKVIKRKPVKKRKIVKKPVKKNKATKKSKDFLPFDVLVKKLQHSNRKQDVLDTTDYTKSPKALRKRKENFLSFKDFFSKVKKKMPTRGRSKKKR